MARLRHSNLVQASLQAQQVLTMWRVPPDMAGLRDRMHGTSCRWPNTPDGASFETRSMPCSSEVKLPSDPRGLHDWVANGDVAAVVPTRDTLSSKSGGQALLRHHDR